MTPSPAPLGVGHVAAHAQLPPDVDVDAFATRLRELILELEPRALVFTVRQPARPGRLP